MAKMQEFKCPCCGGSIEFDSSAQKMKCPFCDTEFDVKTLSEHAKAVEEEQPEDMNWSDEAGSEWQDGEREGLRTYTCKSCGGEIVGDANTAATACPFCGRRFPRRRMPSSPLHKRPKRSSPPRPRATWTNSSAAMLRAVFTINESVPGLHRSDFLV